MPRQDGTGPRGVGPMTGGGKGRCNSDPIGSGNPQCQSNNREFSPWLRLGALLLPLLKQTSLSFLSSIRSGRNKS
jgi:hypothetical protein